MKRNVRRMPRLSSDEEIARWAPEMWRTGEDLRKAGFVRISGGPAEAVSASRVRRLTAQMAVLRKKAGLTQGQVARRMGTTASAVSRMESATPGNLTIETLDRYARAIGAELRFSLMKSSS